MCYDNFFFIQSKLLPNAVPEVGKAMDTLCTKEVSPDLGPAEKAVKACEDLTLEPSSVNRKGLNSCMRIYENSFRCLNFYALGGLG